MESLVASEAADPEVIAGVGVKVSARRPNTAAALRNPNFRLYFAGQLVSISGTYMQAIAEGYLVFKLTQSEFWLGVVACAAGLPVVLMSPIAGVLVERIPRRRLMMITQTIQLVLAAILAFLTFTGAIQVWHNVVLAFCLGVTNALDMPARQTLVVEVVGREDMSSGIALTSILNSTGRVLGPTVAGLVLVQFGPAVCFLLNSLSFVAVLISLFFMKVPYAIKRVSESSALALMKDGLNYARRDPVVAPLILIAAVVGLFIIPIIQMLPAFADVVLKSPEEAYAAMSVGQGIGSVIAGVAVGGLALRFGYGKLIATSILLVSVATVLLSLQVTIPLAVVCCGLFGMFLILQMVSLNTSVQMAVPDAYRGRVMSLYVLALLGLAPFGALALGGIATIIGTSAAIALYGILGGVLGSAILFRWRTVIAMPR